MLPVTSSPPARITRIRPIGNTAAPRKLVNDPQAFGIVPIT